MACGKERVSIRLHPNPSPASRHRDHQTPQLATEPLRYFWNELRYFPLEPQYFWSERQYFLKPLQYFGVEPQYFLI